MPAKIDVAVYFEGVYIPVNSVSVQSEIGRPPMANIAMPYMGKSRNLMITTTVAIFCRYHQDDHKDIPIIDAYKLIFHGEITSLGISRSGIHSQYTVMAEAPSSYLNRMPNQFAWAYRRDEYPQAVEDYNFLGLMYGGTGRAFTIRWFTDGTILQLAGEGEYRHESGAIMNPSHDMYDEYNAPNLDGGDPGVDIAQAGIREPYGMGKIGMPRDGGRRVHQGEDYGTDSGAGDGAPLYIPYNECIVKELNPTRGLIEFEMPDKLHLIRMFHTQDIQTQYRYGSKLDAGTMIGRVGSVKTKHAHLHIELWTKSNPNAHNYDVYSYDLGNPTNRDEMSRGVYGIYHAWPDCLMRVLGKGKYSGGSAPKTYDAAKNYSLEDYVFSLIDTLSTCADTKEMSKDGVYYMYYVNASERHNIKANNVVIDYPEDSFDTHFGADRHDSYMTHTYGNLSKYRGIMYSQLVNNLSKIGYISYTVLSPMYDENNHCLKEYITTPAFYNHLPPQFNVIDISGDDHVSIMDSGTSTTALKMKSTLNMDTIRSIYSPPELVEVRIENGNMEEATDTFNHAHPSIVTSESIYGLKRRVQEVSYFYEVAFRNASSAGSNDGVKSMAQRLCDMNRRVGMSGTHTVNAGISGLNLNLVAGLPGMVHCPIVGKDYFGMIAQVSHTIDLVSGHSSTNVIMMNTTSRAQEGGVSPKSYVDESISENLNDFYRENFYDDEDEDAVYYVTNHGAGMVNIDMLPRTNRKLCSMRDYLHMNRHRALIDDEHKTPIDEYTDILDIDNFVTTSDGMDAKPKNTLEKNATDILKIDRISDLYILEKYEAAIRMAGDIMKSGRIVQTEGE